MYLAYEMLDNVFSLDKEMSLQKKLEVTLVSF